MKEIFKDIPNYKGLYQVSNLGNVKSLKRLAKRGNGVLPVKEKILKKMNYNGYFKVFLNKNGISKNYKIHQLIAITFLNHIPNGLELVIDHINHDSLDNRLENLQIITNRENCSKDRFRHNHSSKYVGVNWHIRDKRWQASITIKNKNKYLGYYKSEIEASNAYQKALKELL